MFCSITILFTVSRAHAEFVIISFDFPFVRLFGVRQFCYYSYLRTCTKLVFCFQDNEINLNFKIVIMVRPPLQKLAYMKQCIIHVWRRKNEI